MDRIRELRNLKNVSQARLAVTAGMDPATLNRIEQGKGNPNLKTLEKLANALEVSVADLLDDSPKARRSSPVAADSQAGEERNPEALRKEFRGYSDTLDVHLRQWEDAAAQLRERGVPYHDGWALTVVYAAMFLWNDLEQKGVLDELKPKGAFAEAIAAGEDLPDPLRQEVERLHDCIGRLTRIAGIAIKAEEFVLEDRRTGTPTEVVYFMKMEARGKNLDSQSSLTTGAESA